MDMEDWTKLIGRPVDDPAVKTAMAKAGVKTTPKLKPHHTDVQVVLKGDRLELTLTDEAYLKNLEDQDLGEGPLIVTGVLANLEKKRGADVYEGPLPYKLTSSDSQATVRKKLGMPKRKSKEFRSDGWDRAGLTLSITYTDDFSALSTLALTDPDSD